jgi:Cu-Zn family superoxide dismutase
MQQQMFLKLLCSALVFSAVSFSSCNNSKDKTTTTHDAMSDSSSSKAVSHAVATLSGTKPDTVVTGSIQFDQEGSKVKMKLDITVPSKANQSVAIHLHDHGDCGNMGKGAMGHWNPTGSNHGKWGSASFHSGDIGNISLDAKGHGTLELETDLWSLGGDAKTNILDRSVIIHSGVDDYTTQPTGNAGERIGCAVIKAVP